MALTRRLRLFIRRLQQPSELKSYLALAGPKRIQIGCGGNILPGWFNTDSDPQRGASYLDAIRMTPLPSAAFDTAFCEHMIEHVPQAEAVRMIGEMFRILKPGGSVRIVTPSLAAFCRLALAPDTAGDYLAWYREYFKKPLADEADAINEIFYSHGHRFIWSERRLAKELSRAGFIDVRPYAPSEYGDSAFHGIDRHGEVIGAVANSFESFAIEARKPSR